MEKNLLLVGWKQSKEIELSMLGDKVGTPSCDDLIEAAQVLNHAIYLRYKTFQHRVMNELEKECGFNGEGKKVLSI